MAQNVQLPEPQTPALPSIDITPVLNGVTYTLRLYWNATDQGWRVRVLDDPGQTPLMGDNRLSVDWPRYRSIIVRTPPGLLILVDTTNQAQDCTLEGLGGRWLLWYYSQAETIAAGIP